MKLMNLTKRATQAGFTMIELLVVIAILGVLAVVVLGAINPLEQINRGRDTSSRADSESMIGAIERYNANIGRYPWMYSETDTVPVAPMKISNTSFTDGGTPNCPVLDLLGQGNTTGPCTGTQEIKAAMVERIDGLVNLRGLYIYNRGLETGDSTYICFSPQSNAFRQQAQEQCTTWTTTPPNDVVGATFMAAFCPASGNNIAGEARPMVCLP